MVKLTSNLLDSIADKLFKLREDGLNDRMDSIFKFMLCSSRCKDSVLRQFKRMSKVVFRHSTFGAVESCTDADRLQADFFYYESKLEAEDRPEPMPFSVDGWFVGYLMQYGILQVKHIVFERSLVEKMESRCMLPAEDLSEMRVIDLVSELVGLEEKSPGVSQCQPSDLQLDCVEGRIPGPSTQDDLNRFIALAPKKLVIKLENQVPVKPEEVSSERIQFPAIETVLVEVEDLVKNGATWPDFLHFLTASCPKLRLLDVRYTLFALGAGGSWLGDWIEQMVRSLQDEIFPDLMRECGSDAVVNFEMRSSLYEWEIDFQQSDHPVLRLGEPVHKPPFVISRSVVVKREEESQAPWHISFHIGAEDPDEEDFEDDYYDGFEDYDGFENYDGFDGYGDCDDYDGFEDYGDYENFGDV